MIPTKGLFKHPLSKSYQSQIMTNRVRFSFKIDDIRSRIENLHPKVWWREMSLAAQVRTLLLERVEQIEQERSTHPSNKPQQ